MYPLSLMPSSPQGNFYCSRPIAFFSSEKEKGSNYFKQERATIPVFLKKHFYKAGSGLLAMADLIFFLLVMVSATPCGFQGRKLGPQTAQAGQHLLCKSPVICLVPLLIRLDLPFYCELPELFYILKVMGEPTQEKKFCNCLKEFHRDTFMQKVTERRDGI